MKLNSLIIISLVFLGLLFAGCATTQDSGLQNLEQTENNQDTQSDLPRGDISDDLDESIVDENEAENEEIEFGELI